ncbi:MAG: glycosyltransferase family 4 protein [Planctomycetota bacterium]|nr:glycosyltransferase family 4 protein [Planctomycetota bacterium]MDA1177919.1 glycosyltransferase family 4 protein [Planctomycetota bacterium]
MRIAHIITRLIIGGAQENTVLCCEDLQKDFGDEVLLISGPSPGREGDLEEDARRRGVRIIIDHNLRRNLHPWYDLKAYRSLRRVIGQFQPDVVHTHSAKGGVLGRTAAWSKHVPAIIHTVHGAPFHAYQSQAARYFFRNCEHFAARRCHALISVADAMTNLLVDAQVAEREKFTTIYSGMEIEPFLQADRHREAARARWQFTSDDFVVGKIARLFYLKGHEFLIDAAHQAIRQNPRLRFLLVGDGILRESIARRIAAAGLTHHFRFTGLLPPSEIPKALAAMDLVVHTSLREGLARVLPQALLAGRTAVSFDIDGAGEVIRHQETGLLVRPGDTAELTTAILRLAGSPTERDQFASRGRLKCQQVFCHHHMTGRIRQVYERSLQAAPERTKIIQRSP